MKFTAARELGPVVALLTTVTLAGCSSYPYDDGYYDQDYSGPVDRGDYRGAYAGVAPASNLHPVCDRYGQRCYMTNAPYWNYRDWYDQARDRPTVPYGYGGGYGNGYGYGYSNGYGY